MIVSPGMPKLDWPSKTKQPLPEGKLITDLISYPALQSSGDSRLENRLILGDNLPVMSALMGEYEGKIDLIYVDPPFFTNKGYAARVGRGEDSRKPEEWKLAEGYADEWDDLESYLDMLYPRLQAMHRLLAPTGSLFLHLDWHANSYARVLLDEIFGYNNLRNEIIWTYHGPSPIRTAFNRKHDMILFYSKTDQYRFDVDAVRADYELPGGCRADIVLAEGECRIDNHKVQTVAGKSQCFLLRKVFCKDIMVRLIVKVEGRLLGARFFTGLQPDSRD